MSCASTRCLCRPCWACFFLFCLFLASLNDFSPNGSNAGFHPPGFRRCPRICPQLAHTPPTGPARNFGGVASLSGSQNRTQGRTGPSLVFLLQNKFTPPPKGGGAGYRFSWVCWVCLACSQLAHAGPTGPVTRFAGVVPLLGSQIRTQGHTGPSSFSASFLETPWSWQHYQVPLQVVIHCLLDGANSKSQCPVPHLARFSAHLGWFHINEPFVLQLPNILCNRVGTHSSGLANAPDAGPTLMRFPVLAENQVGINRQFARD